MKTVKVRITLELESPDRKAIYDYLQELIDDDNLHYDILNKDDDSVARHPLADL